MLSCFRFTLVESRVRVRFYCMLVHGRVLRFCARASFFIAVRGGELKSNRVRVGTGGQAERAGPAVLVLMDHSFRHRIVIRSSPRRFFIFQAQAFGRCDERLDIVSSCCDAPDAMFDRIAANLLGRIAIGASTSMSTRRLFRFQRRFSTWSPPSRCASHRSKCVFRKNA